jgi:hypothetical protein
MNRLVSCQQSNDGIIVNDVIADLIRNLLLTLEILKQVQDDEITTYQRRHNTRAMSLIKYRSFSDDADFNS